MEQHNIFCGGLKPPTKPKLERVLELDVQGDNKNIEFKIETISKALLANIPDELLDLLEIAAYVYCADQRCSRGSEILTDYGSQWRRVMNFKIPVRKPEVWNAEELKKPLKDTLAFLSDETYEFEFVAATTPLAEKQGYFDFADSLVDTDEIALFSGGLDSFAGAVDGIIGQNRKMTLVGHHSSDKVKSVQKHLIQALSEKGHEQKVNYISVAVRNKNSRAVEYTQRTRSFLFASLAACITHMQGKDRFTFYENGVVSLNLPITKDIIGGRATRTTHPKVIEGFRHIFSTALGKDIKIDHPFQWLTKKEITLKIKEHGAEDLLVKTNSCTRPRIWTQHEKHCVMCSQCIDRRFAILAADMGEYEAASNYMVDLLLEDRSQDEDNGMKMAASYVKFAQHFVSMTKDRFISEYPAISSALKCFAPLSTAEAEQKIFDMFQRHACDVIAVLNKGFDDNRAALVQNPSPIASGCILALAFNRSKIEPVKPDNYDAELKETLDGLKRHKIQFYAAEDGLVFKGGYKIDGAGYEVIKHLLPSFRQGKKSGDFAYVTTVGLKDLLKDVDDNSFYKRINRLRDDIKANLGTSHGLVDDFIENQQRQGYRLNPNLREVNSLADLED